MEQEKDVIINYINFSKLFTPHSYVATWMHRVNIMTARCYSYSYSSCIILCRMNQLAVTGYNTYIVTFQHVLIQYE